MNFYTPLLICRLHYDVDVDYGVDVDLCRFTRLHLGSATIARPSMLAPDVEDDPGGRPPKGTALLTFDLWGSIVVYGWRGIYFYLDCMSFYA